MGKMNNLKKKRLMRRNMVGYSFIAPNFIGFAVFTMMPMLFSFGLSFCEWDSSIRSSLLVYRILLDYCQMIPFGFL